MSSGVWRDTSDEEACLFFSGLSCDSLASTQSSSTTAVTEDTDSRDYDAIYHRFDSYRSLGSSSDDAPSPAPASWFSSKATYVVRTSDRGRACVVEGCPRERRSPRAKYCTVHKHARPDSTMRRASRLHIARLLEAGVIDDDRARAVHARRQCKNADGRFAFRRGVCRACYDVMRQSNLPDESLSLS